jgi:predicted small metal-binding protein
MTDQDPRSPGTDVSPVCDCGYRCQGESVDDRVRDGQRHARIAHGIEVSEDQILREPNPT